MAKVLDTILDLVKRKVAERAGGGTSGGPGAGGIFGQITEMLGQRGAKPKPQAHSQPRPASEDPYGDPADAKGAKNVRPASEDPYGDPADQKA